MHTLWHLTLSKRFLTATCILSLTLLALAFATPLRAQDVLTACGVRVKAGTRLSWQRDGEADPPLCVLQGEGGPAVPFAKSITVLRWDQLGRLQVNGTALRDIGFFRITKGNRIRFIGRPTYEDSRNAYSQKVVGKPKQSEVTLVDGSRRLVVRTELRVTWLKPATVNVQDEVDQAIVCVDSATSNQVQFAIFNWCVPKQDQTLDLVKRMADSLSLTER